MRQVGDLIAGRFEVTEVGRSVVGRDVASGARVYVRDLSPRDFLDVAATKPIADAVAALGEPFVPALLTDPLVYLAPPALDSEPHLEAARLYEIGLELLAAITGARQVGVPVAAGLAWLSAEGRLQLPAPIGAAGLHYERFDDRLDGWDAYDARSWLRARLQRREHLHTFAWLDAFEGGTRDLMRELAARCADRARAEAVLAATPPYLARRPLPDIDLAIELGEDRYAQADAEARAIWTRESEHASRARVLQPLAWALAAAYHHRACVHHAAGSSELALSDARRAVELDPQTRYLTTLALIGPSADAGAILDRAVEAIEPRPKDIDGIVVYTPSLEASESAGRDAVRTLHARGLARARDGDRAGAIADLERAMTRLATETALRLRR